ncbi:hypothetical protein MLD38_031736 [Melastoma candidum]|uniref:Uncharacterized protein n=1 Tax=Melastoma candidum TaxID=119954 RepID=A0ACB9MRS3_9MYRT|nr:hypothetical protein MLD38_031736 [Melastoma candidum]
MVDGKRKNSPRQHKLTTNQRERSEPELLGVADDLLGIYDNDDDSDEVMGNATCRSAGEVRDGEGSFGDGREMYAERIDGGTRVSPVPSRMSIETVNSRNQRPVPVMIMWSHGGRQIFVTGSWDNWAVIEPMHRSGEEFILMKLLPSGLYHYHFIVDGNITCDRDFPFSFDDSGGKAYNILDVKEFAAESSENLPESALPDSPEDGYGRNSNHDVDFSKPPPDLPPQMYKPLLAETPPSWADVHQLVERPQHVALNHLYMKSCDGRVVALSSTQRFLEKFVTVIIYKSVRQR